MSPPPKPRNQPSGVVSRYHGPSMPTGDVHDSGRPSIDGVAEIERPVDDDLEREPCAGAELQHAHAARRAVGELYQAHARDLLQPADAGRERGLVEGASVDAHQCMTQPPSTSSVWPEMKPDSGDARNSTACAMSSALPRRLTLWLSRMRRSNAS